MRQRLFFALTIGLYIFFASACRSPTPVIIVITATPAPAQPTLTPLPVLPSATPLPPPTAIPPTSPPILPAPPTNTPLPAQPPPPAQPTATPVLPQLGVFDQGGGNMDIFVFGGQIGARLVFRAIACAPNCNNRPDGRDVNVVKFAFFRTTPQGQQGSQVYEHSEVESPYCAFGGSGRCDFLNIADPNTRWPNTNNIIANGDYILRVTSAGKNSAQWDGKFRFRVQR